MYKKFNIKTLAIIVGVLLVIIIVSQMVDRMKGDRSFKEYLVEADSASINHILIKPLKQTNYTELENKKGWKVLVKNNKWFPADEQDIAQMIQLIKELKPIRVAGNTSESWRKYEVTDSAATRVIFKNGDKTIADFLIGKFTYQQTTRKMTSYVRLYDEKTVYAVDGFLSMTFNREPNSFRSKNLVSGTPQNWTKLAFTYPADSSFELSLVDNKWKLDVMDADSAKTVKYLQGIGNLSGYDFNDSINVALLPAPAFKVKVEGNNFTAFEISCYVMGTQKVLNSSVNPDAYFTAKQAFDKLFKPSKNFRK